jgi:hypothetical protein
VVARGQGEEEMGNQCLMDVDFQFYKMERVLERDGGGGGGTL